MLNSLPLPITVITVGNKNKKAAMTASWVNQLSWSPPYIGVAIYHSWYTLKLIREYREFAVHLVSSDLVEAAVRIFGSMSSKKVDKFKIARITVVPSKRVKAPIIIKAPIVYECKVIKILKIGDHYLVIGEPLVAYRNNDKLPVILYDNVHKIGDLIKVYQKNPNKM